MTYMYSQVEIYQKFNFNTTKFQDQRFDSYNLKVAYFGLVYRIVIVYNRFIAINFPLPVIHKQIK